MDKKQITIGLTFVLLILAFSGCTDMNVDEITQFSITKFEVKPTVINAGETANLSWLVMSAQTVSIDNGIGSVSNTGTRVIQPSETTTYILTASNKTKSLTATTQIIVNENSDSEDSEEDNAPSISFKQDKSENTLTVMYVEEDNIKWSDFYIYVFEGSFDSSDLGTYVEVGDVISDCDGVILIMHNETLTTLGSWVFGDIPSESPSSTPNMQLVKDTTNRKLTVASADPGDLIWSDFEITGDCDTSELGTNVIAGDTITDCSVTIRIRHIPTNTLIGTWDFN